MKITPTGISALAIKGETLNSGLHIQPKAKTLKPLNGEAQRKFCNKMQSVKFLIIDEYSMIGLKTLGFIEKRCKEGTGNHEEQFGGIHVLMCGDIAQLPPVKETAIYKSVRIKKIPVLSTENKWQVTLKVPLF